MENKEHDWYSHFTGLTESKLLQYRNLMSKGLIEVVDSSNTIYIRAEDNLEEHPVIKGYKKSGWSVEYKLNL